MLVQFQRQIEPAFERHAFVRSPRWFQRIPDHTDSQGGLLSYSLVDCRLLETL